MNNHHWTPDDDLYIARNKDRYTREAMADKLGCTVGALQTRIGSLEPEVPVYVGKVATAPGINIWAQPTYPAWVPPKPVCARDGGEDASLLPSGKVGAEARYKDRGHL